MQIIRDIQGGHVIIFDKLRLYTRHAQHTARGPNVARRGLTFGLPTLDEIEYHQFNRVL